MATKQPNRYEKIILTVFKDRFVAGSREVVFERDDLATAAAKLKVKLPDNLGDLIYSFRYRVSLPREIRDTAPMGEEWTIRQAGKSRYRFSLVKQAVITPNPHLMLTKIPNATPGIIDKYALTDEQSLLAKLRYNRLIDVFSGVTCYSLQNHLRTTVTKMGQIETDELYVGVNNRGAHFVFPVQVKGGRDQLSIVQIEQDMAMCIEKFPALCCRPIGAQFMSQDTIALFEFVETEDGISLTQERHYRLVPPAELTSDDLAAYSNLL